MTDARDADEAVELPIDGVLDLHTFQPRDVKSLVPEYLDECRGRGIAEVRIIHGKGKGVLRRTVHAILERRTDVVEFGLAPAQRGGWGATLVTLDVGAAWAAESKGAERKGAESKAERTGEEETEIGTSTADTSAVGASAVGTAGADRLDSPNPLAERASGPQASGRMARVAKVVVRWLVTFAMVYVGVLHFVDPMPFVRIVPDYLPEPELLVYVSGAFEVLGGLGLIFKGTRRWASYGLIALFIAVFPANIHMLVHEIQLEPGGDIPVWAMWARLPFQFVFIAAAWWVGRPDENPEGVAAAEETVASAEEA